MQIRNSSLDKNFPLKSILFLPTDNLGESSNCCSNIFSVAVVERNTNHEQPTHPVKLHSPPVSTLIMLSKSDENIPKSKGVVSNQPVPIADVPKLNICLPKWARLNLSKTYLSIWIILQKIFQNIADVGEMHLIW